MPFKVVEIFGRISMAFKYYLQVVNYKCTIYLSRRVLRCMN